jgi:hypothetical protein
MSGYLQRLISSAQAPRAAIRPVVGSLFSNSMYPGSAEGFQAVEETVATRQPAQPEFLATPVPRPPRGLQPEPESHPARRETSHVEPHAQASQAVACESSDEDFQAKEESVVSGQPGGPSPVSETRTSFTTLVTEVPRDTRPALETSDEGDPRVKHIAGSDEGDPRVKHIASAELPLERPDQQVIRQKTYRPLVAEGLRPSNARAFQNWSSLASDGQRIEKADLPRRVAQPERETDEIQIHIGKIEVAAVPPAPARPAAQPLRKSLRLDEYLRRGRERAL